MPQHFTSNILAKGVPFTREKKVFIWHENIFENI
jgi:hypothetical protein